MKRLDAITFTGGLLIGIALTGFIYWMCGV